MAEELEKDAFDTLFMQEKEGDIIGDNKMEKINKKLSNFRVESLFTVILPFGSLTNEKNSRKGFTNPYLIIYN